MTSGFSSHSTQVQRSERVATKRQWLRLGCFFSTLEWSSDRDSLQSGSLDTDAEDVCDHGVNGSKIRKLLRSACEYASFICKYFAGK
jgi:hypothetical protein